MTDRRLLHPVQKMLLDAADYIEANGHHKGEYFGPDGPNGNPSACIVGAMIEVTLAPRRRKLTLKQYDLVGEGLQYLSDRRDDVDDIRAWNDDLDRTAAEVIQELRDGAAAYEPA